MQRIKEFLQGKKTYISAAALGLVAIAGFLLGYVGGTEATALLSTAGALAGLGAKSQRTADMIMTALAEVRSVQAAAATSHKPIDAKQFAVDVGKQVLSQVVQSGAAVPVPGLSITGSTFTTGDLNAAQTCIFCGQAWNSNNTVCISPLNKTQLDTVGNRHHVIAAVNWSPAK